MPGRAPTPQPAARSLVVDLAGFCASGILLALAFPRPGWWPLAHVALVPAILLALTTRRPGRLLWVSWLTSFLWWLWTLRWLVPVTSGGYAVLAAFLAFYSSGFLLLLRGLRQRYPILLTLLVPAVWVPLEMVRGAFPAGGFGWYALAHSQAPWRAGQWPGPLIQVADLFAEHGVSFLVAMSNGLVADIGLNRWSAIRTTRGKARQRAAMASLSNQTPLPQPVGLRRLVGAAGLWLLAYLGASLYGLARLGQLPADPRVRVAVIQTNIPQDNKERPTLETDRQIWQQLDELTRLAGEDPDVDLIVWPESTTPAPLNEEAVAFFDQQATFWRRCTVQQLVESKEAEAFAAMARGLSIELVQLPRYQADRYGQWALGAVKVAALVRQVDRPLLAGSLTGFQGLNQRQHNSVYLFDAGGVASASRYDKCHLVPFGEFIPWVPDQGPLKRWIIQYLTPYDHDYTLVPGTDVVVFQIERRSARGQSLPVRLVTPICFEDTVPRLMRRMIYAGSGKRVDLVVSVSNDGWFAGSMEGSHHLQAAALRCVENRVPMARSVNTGPSGFIDAVGRIGPVVTSNGRTQQVQGIAVCDLKLDGRATVYGRFGTLPVMGLLIATAMLAGATGGRRIARPPPQGV